METLQEFKNRTEGFSSYSIYSDDVFTVNPNVGKKVNSTGHFNPFFGDTTVFLLSKETMGKIAVIQDKLYEKAGEMLSERLKKDTFHITLHDLTSSQSKDDILWEMDSNKEKAKAVIEKIHSEGGKIKMRTTYLFNMMNTSMVLGFAPVDDENCKKLMEMYEAMQQVKWLNYPLTPHVTIAYFKPNEYYHDSIAKLKEVITEVKKEGFETELDCRNLVYQRFSDMNNYIEA